MPETIELPATISVVSHSLYGFLDKSRRKQSHTLTFLKNIWLKPTHTTKLLELLWSIILPTLITPIVVVVPPTALAAEPSKLLGDFGQLRIDHLKQKTIDVSQIDFPRREKPSCLTCLASVSTDTRSLACLKLEGVKKA